MTVAGRWRKIVFGLVLIGLLLGAVLYGFVVQGTLADMVREAVVSQVTTALGRKVTLSGVSGDPLRGVALEGVHVSTRTGAPAGTFFEAPRLIAHFQIFRLIRDLLTGRGVTSSLTAVEVDRPFLVLTVDAKGQWNYADLLAHAQATAAPNFAGTIEVREGTLVFTDASATPARPFLAHFERITGTLDLAQAPRIRISADAINTDGETPAILHVAGTAGLDDGTVDLDLMTRGAPAAHWGPYVAPLPWLLWQGGTVEGTLHLLISPNGLGTTLDYRGQLFVRHGRALVLPQRTPLSDVVGPLAVDTSSVSTTGLTMTVGTSPVFVRGDVSLGSGVAMDLVLRSESLDLATLQHLLFPTAKLRVSGVVRGEARVVGPADALEITGTIADGVGMIADQPFAHLSTDFQYAGGLLGFDELGAATSGGTVHGALRLDLDGGTFFVLADGHELNAGAIVSALGMPPTPSLQGRISGFVAAAGKPGAIIAQGRVQMGRGSVYGTDFDGAESLFWYGRGGLEVDHFAVSNGAASVHASGTMAPTGALALDVVARNVNLKSVGSRFGIASAMTGTADLGGSISGSVESPVFTGELEAHHGTLGPLPYSLARGDVRVTPTGLSTGLLTLRDGAALFQAAGAVQWNGTQHLDMTMQASGVPAQQLVDLGGVPLQVGGTVQGTVRFFGEGSNIYAQGAVALRDGTIEGQRLDAAQASFRLDASGLILEQAVADIGGSTIEAQGTVGRNGVVAITFAAHAFDLQTLSVLNSDLMRATGTVDLTGTMSGTVSSPAVTAQLSATALNLNGQLFDAASGSAGYRGGRLSLMPLDLQQGQGRFRVSGSLEFRRESIVNLDASVHGAELTTLLGLARVTSPVPVQGRVDGTFAASGPLRNPAASLNFQLTDGKLGDHPVREAVVRAELANHAVTLQTFSIKPERGELVGVGHINLRGTSDVEFSGRGLPLDIVRPVFRLKRPLQGDLDFIVQASGTLADPQVGISTAVTKGAIGEASFDRLVAQLFYRDGLLHVEEGLLQEGKHKVKAEGTVPFNPAQFRFDDARPMDLRLFLADADLSVLGVLTDQIERAEGPLVGEVLLSGSASQPRMVGSLTVADGMIKLKNLEPALTGVHGNLTFNADEIRVGSLEAKLGAGTVSVSGSVGIRDFRAAALDLQLAVHGARLTYTPYFVGVVDSEVHLGGSATTPDLSGTVMLSQGDLFVPRTSPADPSAAKVAGLPVGLNLDVLAGEGLWVNAGSLRLQVSGTVHASGTRQQPRLSGAVEASRGTFSAFNSTFTLLEGQATFAEFRGTTPYLDARAVTHIGQTTIYVQIQGTPDDPDLLLSSDPPLSHRQIVALLAGQAGIAQLRGDQEGALRLQLSQVFFGSVGVAVGRALGFEEFTIQYEPSQPLQLRIGRLVVDNLYITFEERFVTPDPYYAWSLDFRLAPTSTVSFSVDNKATHMIMYRYTVRF